jgi:hypothetical protein
MRIFDNEVTAESRETIEKYLQSMEYRASGLAFTSLYMWRDINAISWEEAGGYLCIAGDNHLDEGDAHPFAFLPLTKTGVYEPEGLRRAVLHAKSKFQDAGYSFFMKLVPFHLLESLHDAFPGEFIYIPDRDNYDYVYRTADLSEFKGRDLHKKKNHLNYFLNHFPEYRYDEMTEDDADEAIAFIREFNLRKGVLAPNEMKLLEHEELAMQDVFKNLSKIGYISGAIRIGGRIEAMSIGGRLGRNTVVCHIEKANTEFRGLYQAICSEYCKKLACRFKYVNREEDMGLQGLRKAKLSLHPARMVEKFTVMFK